MRVFILTFLLFNCLLTSVQATNADTLYVKPNPCDTLTTIHFEISQSSTISLDLYNRWGQLVKNFYERAVLASGTYEIVYNADFLPSDVYILRLQINSVSKVVKLLKNKTILGLHEQPTILNKIDIFPNPTSRNLNIEYNGLKSVYLFDLNGKIIYKNYVDLNVLNLSNVATGIYILQIYSADKKLITNQKIVLTE
jgi:hypothetical protein